MNAKGKFCHFDRHRANPHGAPEFTGILPVLPEKQQEFRPRKRRGAPGRIHSLHRIHHPNQPIREGCTAWNRQAADGIFPRRQPTCQPRTARPTTPLCRLRHPEPSFREGRLSWLRKRIAALTPLSHPSAGHAKSRLRLPVASLSAHTRFAIHPSLTKRQRSLLTEGGGRPLCPRIRPHAAKTAAPDRSPGGRPSQPDSLSCTFIFFRQHGYSKEEIPLPSPRSHVPCGSAQASPDLFAGVIPHYQIYHLYRSFRSGCAASSQRAAVILSHPRT